jgi:hypothetical protein
MKETQMRHPRALALAATLSATAAVAALPATAAADQNDQGHPLIPGNLLVSSSVYGTGPTIVPGTTQLPPGCAAANCVTATADGTYPTVFNNNLVDGSFGVTSRIFLDELTPFGLPLDRIEVPNSTQPGITSSSDQMVTSFSSKSEMALNLSTSGRAVTFMGYEAPVDAVDVSNSNTPGVIDPTNPVPSAYYRVIAQLDRSGHFHFTLTNAYSGNNGRAAILNDSNGTNVYYAAGNAGNGGKHQPAGVIIGAGAQFAIPAFTPEADQTPGDPTPLGSFNITQLGLPADKIGKDTNFRGLTVFNNVVYYTKGSGGNGINTVYFVDTTGTACPNGVGLPVPGAPLPTSPLAYDPATVTTAGLQPTNMCILKGFPATTASTNSAFPFGIWFANPNTLYAADEGNGNNTFSTATGQYTNAAAQTTAGLQKWVFNKTSQSWQLAYTLQSGLNLGQPYKVPGYPTGTNAATGLPWSPATDGLRNLTGRVNPDGSVTLWAITSTVSGSGDQGADPNKLVTITDRPGAAAPARFEAFRAVRIAPDREVLRGVSLTPGSPQDDQGDDNQGNQGGNGQ